MPVEYEVPEGVTYGCTMCGDCCRSYHVIVTEQERARIESLDFSGKVHRLAGVPKTKPSREPGTEQYRALDRRDDERCIFLGERNQCLIHEHFGEEAKPLTCQLYPYSFYPMGSKVGVNVAFSCKSVSEGIGPDVRDSQPQWTAQFFHTHGGTDARRHYLTPGQEIPGDLAWEIEHTVMGYLRERDLSFADRVRCALLFLRLGTTGDPLARTAAVFREAIAAGVRKQLEKVDRDQTMDKSQDAVFRQLLFLLHNPTPLQFFEMPTSEREALKGRLVEAGEAFRDRKGPFRFAGEPFPADLEAIDAVDTSFLDQPDQTALETFFCAKIIGQKFLMAGRGELPLVEGLTRLFVYYPMIAWTAKAFAAQRGATELGDGDVRRAIRSLDQTVGLHDFSRLSVADANGRKTVEALRFILLETQFVEAAMNHVLRPRP